MGKLSILKSNRPVAEIIIAQDKLRFSIESNRNIFSINQIKKIDKGLNNDFKKLFSFSCPEVSKFNFNQDSIALWVRSNSYFVISKNIQFDEILSDAPLSPVIAALNLHWSAIVIPPTGKVSKAGCAPAPAEVKTCPSDPVAIATGLPEAS